MLGMFTRLCLGVVLLLAFWLVAVLLLAGLWLFMAYMGGTRAPAIVLVCCLGVMGLAALAIVVAGLGRCVAEANRRR